MKKAGKKFGNAEIDIDIKKKEISFHYPNKNYNENDSFFFHSFYVVLGLIIGLICGSILPKMWLINHGYIMEDLNILYQILAILFLFLCTIGGMVLFGYISLFLHKYSKAARDSFPKTNALIHSTNEFEINLKHKISNIHKIEGKKLIIFNYDIVYFKYCYIGYNKINKIITKSVDYDKKKEEHMKFIAIFLFDKPIKEGFLYYRT